MQVIDEDTKLHIFLIYNVQYLEKQRDINHDQKLLATLQQFMGTTISLEHIRSKLLAKDHLCENLKIVGSRFNHLLGKLPVLPYNPYIDLVSGQGARFNTIRLVAQFSCKYLSQKNGLDMIKYTKLEKYDLSSLIIEQYIHFRHVWETFKQQMLPFRYRMTEQAQVRQQADMQGSHKPICPLPTAGRDGSTVAPVNNSTSEGTQLQEDRDLQNSFQKLVIENEKTLENHEKLIAGVAIHLLPNIENLNFPPSQFPLSRANKKRKPSAPF
jgi:hypothetical protein